MISVNGEQRLPADAEDGAAEGEHYAHGGRRRKMRKLATKVP